MIIILLFGGGEGEVSLPSGRRMMNAPVIHTIRTAHFIKQANKVWLLSARKNGGRGERGPSSSLPKNPIDL